MITNAQAFKEKQHDSLKWQTTQEYLNCFSYQKHPYVSDLIYQPKGGEIYIFYTTNNNNVC